MKRFKIISRAAPDQYASIDAICDRYMTIDTVGHDESRAWQEKNIHANLLVLDNDNQARGYLELLPLTDYAGKMIYEGQWGETDLLPEAILPPNKMRDARMAYIAAIAVDKPQSYIGGRWALALVAACAWQLKNLYDDRKLEKIFLNPTTHDGYHIARKLGFEPISFKIKALKTSHMYVYDIREKGTDFFDCILDRYNKHIDYHIPA